MDQEFRTRIEEMEDLVEKLKSANEKWLVFLHVFSWFLIFFSLNLGLRKSRACSGCGEADPYPRFFSSACGHAVCRECATDAEPCPTCNEENVIRADVRWWFVLLFHMWSRYTRTRRFFQMRPYDMRYLCSSVRCASWRTRTWLASMSILPGAFKLSPYPSGICNDFYHQWFSKTDVDFFLQSWYLDLFWINIYPKSRCRSTFVGMYFRCRSTFVGMHFTQDLSSLRIYSPDALQNASV